MLTALPLCPGACFAKPDPEPCSEADLNLPTLNPPLILRPLTSRYCLQKHGGNVIVFLGNESPLGIPRQPIVFENARRLNALVILVEHRYYGELCPVLCRTALAVYPWG
jgi:hypothetical protein